MAPHDPLTQRAKHELREIEPNPRAWFEGPNDAPKVDIDLNAREPWHRYDPWVLGTMVVICLGCVAFGGWAVWWLLTH